MATSMGAAHASGAAPTLVAVLSAPGAAQPTTLIEGRGNNLRWVPNTITATSVAGTCSSANYSFLITNKTKVAQQVRYQGKNFNLPIPPQQGLFVCADGAVTGTFTLKADRKAKLTFHIT